MPDQSQIDRLRSIIARIEQRPREVSAPLRAAAEDSSVWLSRSAEFLGMKAMSSEHGPVLYRQDEFPGSHLYGKVSLSAPVAPPETYTLLGNDEGLEGFSPEAALFLDIETTGLGHGTGTHAFLVGFAHYEQGVLVTTQYFMPDYAFEEAMLRHITDAYAHKEWLVTYNGRSFDVPILETRYTMNRIRSRLLSAYNFDLLHAARRLWRDAYACNLSALELEIIGHEREDDIPGALIPNMYFDYLRTRDPSFILPVLTHNRWDLLAMAALLSHMCGHVTRPIGQNFMAMELYNLGKLYERAGRLDESVACYREAPFGDGVKTISVKALERLARLEKRRGNHGEALEMLKKAVVADHHCLTAHIELAKLLEHRFKDYEAAQISCDAALSCLERHLLVNPTNKYRALFTDLIKRRERLSKKHGSAAARN